MSILEQAQAAMYVSLIKDHVTGLMSINNF